MSTLVKVNCDRATGRKHCLIVTPEILAKYGVSEVNQQFIDKFNEINARGGSAVYDTSPVVSWHIGVM